MSLISDNWPDITASLNALEPEYADRIVSVVEEFVKPRLREIEKFATSLHPARLPCRVVPDRYTWGQSFAVFEIAFGDPPMGIHTYDHDRTKGSGAVDCSLNSDRQPPSPSPSAYSAPSPQSSSWILRLGMRPMDAYFNTAAQLERKILNEVAALRLVHERTDIPVPRIIAFHAKAQSETNPLGPNAPAFVLMTAMSGATIEDRGIMTSGCGRCSGELAGDQSEHPRVCHADPLQGDESKRPILTNYLHDLARMHAQLSRITFDRIGSFVLDEETGEVSIGPVADFGLGPFTSARDYFALQAEAYERLALVVGEAAASDSAPNYPCDDSGNRIDFPTNSHSSHSVSKKQFVASLWRAAIMPLLDERDDNGPFPMRHGDLHTENILVDEQGHIVGVLDWDCAGTVPWEAFAVPSFEVSGDLVDFGGVHCGHCGHDTGSGDVRTVDTLGRARQSQQPLQQQTEPMARDERPAVHLAFNRALLNVQDSQDAFVPPSGRTLADLHDSYAGYVGAYLAWWMFSMECDYEHTGRALHCIIGSSNDIDSEFQKFLQGQRSMDNEQGQTLCVTA